MTAKIRKRIFVQYHIRFQLRIINYELPLIVEMLLTCTKTGPLGQGMAGGPGNFELIQT
jgi:hypothetical protein